MKFEKEERNRRNRVITGIICVVLVCICLSIYAFGRSEMLGSFAGGGLTLRQVVIATGSDAMETVCPVCGAFELEHYYINDDEECVGCSECVRKSDVMY